MLLLAVAWAQCGYTTSHCAGLSPNLVMDPPSPRCSNELPLTVTLFPLGTGSATLTFYYRLNSTGGWSVISNPGARQHTFTAGQTGNHQFMMVVQGPGGCRDTVIRCYTITQRPIANILSINPPSPRCEAELPLTLSVSAASASSIVSYNWYLNGTLVASVNTPNTTLPNVITTPGNHTIKLVVIDTSGCRDSVQRDYVVNPTPTASFLPSATSLCRGGKVCFTNTSTGTVGGTTYNWNFGDGGTSNRPNPCHPYNNPGTYTVTLQVCNPGGCCHTATQTITVAPGGLADIQGDGLQDTVKYCVLPGDPATTFTVNFTSASDCPGGGCVYTWNFGYDGTTLTTQADTPQVHTYTSFGEGWAYLTVTHPGGCVHKDSIYVVFQPTLVSATFNIPPTAGGCAPYTVTIQNISQSNATIFVWDYGDGQRDTVSPPNTAPFTHTYTSPGTYQIRLDAYNACGQTYAIRGPVVVVGRPSITTVSASPNPGCAPQNVSFSVTATGVQPSNNIHWDFGDGSPEVSGTATPTHLYPQRGIYEVMVRTCNSCGCDTARLTVTIDSLPEANLQAFPLEGCHPLTVTFTNLSQPNMAAGITAPFWEALYIDGGQCCGPWWNSCACRCPRYVDDHHYFAFNGYCWWSQGCCQGSSTSLPGRPMNIPPITFTHTGSNSIRTYTLLYIIGNHCGRDSQRFEIKVHPQVQARFTATPTSACVGTPITFTNNSWGDSLTFIWDWGDGSPYLYDTALAAATQMPRTHVHTYTTPGTYTVTLYVTGHCGRDTLRRTITIHPYPTPAITVNRVEACRQGGSATFTFTNASVGNPPGTTYSWSFPGGSPSSSTASVVNVTYTAPGTYTATLTANYNGCIQSTTQSVTVYPSPTVSFTASPSSGCGPLSVAITNTSPNIPGYTYVWDYGTGAPRDTTYTPASPQVYTNTGSTTLTYTLTLYVITDRGCIDSLRRFITVYPRPVANFSMAPSPACVGVPVTFTNSSSGATSYSWDFGDGSPGSTASNPTHTYALPGTYEVQLVTASTNGCRDTMRRSIVVEPRPSADFSYTIECLGNPTSFTDASTGAVAWQWNFGDGSPPSTLQNPTHTYSAPGSYIVQLVVTGANGCRDTIRKSVPVNPLPRPAFSASSACVGTPTAFTDLTGGTPTSWRWDFGDGSPPSTVQNPTHLYAAPGTYNVKLVVTSGTGCVDSVTQPVVVHPLPQASFTASSACARDEAVSFTNSSSGATAYQWDFGDGSPPSTAPNPTHIYLAGGTYTVQLIAINAQGCRDTAVQDITIFPKPQLSFQADTVCFGQATTFAGSSTEPLVSWQWDFGDGQTASGATTTHTYAAAGVYVVQLVGQTAQGCRDTFSKQVVVNPVPTAAFSASNVCFGEEVTFTDQSVGATAWVWDFGDGSPTSTQQNPSHLYAGAGTYTVTLTVYNSSACFHVSSQAVTVKPKPIASFTADTVCWGSATSFSDQSVGATTWLWDFGDTYGSTLQNPQHTYAQPGTYLVSLIVTNAQGCKDTLQKPVVVHPRPTAGFTYDTACALRPLQFTDTSQGIVTFWLWDFGDGSQSTLQNPVHIYAAGGTYTVTLIVGNGVGCTDQFTAPVAVYTMPRVDFSADTVCVGRPTSFTNLTQDAVPVSYVWLFGDGNASFAQNPTYIYQAPGTYWVTLLATNANGCDTFITKPVVVAPIPQANFTADTACVGRATVFTDATQGLVDKWIWEWGDGQRDTVQTPTAQHLYPAPGVYVVSMTALFGGCSNTITKGIRVVDSVRAQILLSDTLICPGEAITALDASTGGAQWWVWDLGNGQTLTSQHATNVPYPTPGLYSIQLVAGNGYCVDTARATLYVIGQPQALFSLQDACVGMPLVLQNTSFPSDLPVQWFWDFGNGDTSHSATPSYSYSRPGTYTVTLILHNGRCGDTLRQQVNIWPNPVATIQVRDSLTRILKEIYFADLTPGTIVQREWNLGDGATSTRQEFSYMYADTGTYLVRLIVVDEKGCRDTAYQRVVVYGEFSLYVPTAFSPNGDGVNDVFYPGGVWFDVYDFLFQIYNRWGQLIWETRERGHAWDGRDMRTGEPVPEDAYVFRVRGRDFKGKHHEYVGTVTVLK